MLLCENLIFHRDQPMHYDSVLVLSVVSFVCAVILGFNKFAASFMASATLDNTPPFFVAVARILFPIALVLLLLRAFLLEHFIVPSHSMVPTLKSGDYILVSKFAYGLRLPILNHLLFPIGDPQRGDVVVFRYPEDRSIPFIKRIIGLPRDTITYENKTLTINGKAIAKRLLKKHFLLDESTNLSLYESHGKVPYNIVENDNVKNADIDGTWVVPENSYFVMGDNRDGSHDSRAWGFVAKHDLLGKAFMIWMNATKEHGIAWERVGMPIH